VGVEHVVIGDRDALASVGEVMGFITQQTTFIPIVLFVVIMLAAQMIATTIASEKENKTLETMLSMPVSRTSIIGAKMVAASMVALLSAVAYMYGMRSFMDGLTSWLGAGGSPFGAGGEGEALSQLGLQLGGGDYAILGLALFMAILVALAVAVILGAFAENVKAVQALMAPLMVMIMIPYFLTLFVDIEQVSPVIKWLVLAIPFSHPFMTAPNLFLGNYAVVFMGIAYEFVWFVVLVVLAGRIFSSDRILTMKLNMGRNRFPGIGRGRRAS
jgi:ABC-2 type transport system permease protein